MINFELFGLLVDWTQFNFSISLGTIQVPTQGYFKSYSLFCLSIMDEVYLEVLGMSLIGKKHFE